MTVHSIKYQLKWVLSNFFLIFLSISRFLLIQNTYLSPTDKNFASNLLVAIEEKMKTKLHMCWSVYFGIDLETILNSVTHFC